MREVELVLKDGSKFSVEVDDKEDELVRASPRGAAGSRGASVSFEDLLNRVEPALRAVATWAERNKPDQCTVELGLKVGGESGLIIAKGTAEANFVVKLSWGRTGE